MAYMRRVILNFLIVFLFINESSFAQSMAVVGADKCGPGDSAAAGNIRWLREALSRKTHLVQSETATVAALGGAPSSTMADIKRVLMGAKSDLNQMAYERAGQAAIVAGRELLSMPISKERCDSFRESNMILAWTHVKLHQDSNAQSVLKKLERIETVLPDRMQFPPSFSQLALQMRAEMKELATSRLSVTTRPLKQQVYIDGCLAGTSPLQLALPPGEYRVEIDFASGRSLPKTVQVQDYSRVEFDSEFEGAIYADRGPCVAFGKDRANRLQSLVRLASILGVRSIVTVREEEPAPGEQYLVATLIDSVTGKDSREARVKVAPGGVSQNEVMEKLAEWVATGDARPPVEDTSVKQPEEETGDLKPEGPREKELSKNYHWQQTAAWSMAGLAFILTGVGIVEQIRINDIEKQIGDYTDEKGNVRSEELKSRVAELEANQLRQTKWRNGFFIGAAIAAAGSGICFWFSASQKNSLASAKTPFFMFAVSGQY
jgi:hypothetical protein